MKCLIVLSVNMPTPEALPEILAHIDPPTIPYFGDEVRIVVGTDVDDTIDFLENG
jgi:hypothetical protein